MPQADATGATDDVQVVAGEQRLATAPTRPVPPAARLQQAGGGPQRGGHLYQTPAARIASFSFSGLAPGS